MPKMKKQKPLKHIPRSRISSRELLDQVMSYECGIMEPKEIFSFFQQLIDSGLAWKLHGGYLSQSLNLIEKGFCERSAPKQLQ